MLQMDDDVYHAKIDHMKAWCSKKYAKPNNSLQTNSEKEEGIQFNQKHII